MSEEFELISVPKELLENLVRRILAEYISLSTPEPEQDEEPVAWMKEDEDGDLEFNTLNQFSCGRTNGTPLYLHPAPRKPFVRLSEREIMILAKRYDVWTHVIRAIEDALEEKNK